MIGGPETVPWKTVGKRSSFSMQPVMQNGRLIMLRVEKRALPPVVVQPPTYVAAVKNETHLQGKLAQDVRRLLHNRPSALWGCKR